MDKRPLSPGGNGIGEVISKDWRMQGRESPRDIDDQAAAEAAERIGKHAFPIHLDITDANSVRQGHRDASSAYTVSEIVCEQRRTCRQAAPVWEQTDDD